jgi:hypothetical protein
MHIQQNSLRHFLQVIWLQPPFFSMVELHFGHSFVFADIQLAVSESSSHFFIHFFTNAQGAGWWSSWVQPKQKARPQSQWTVGTVFISSLSLTPHWIA